MLVLRIGKWILTKNEPNEIDIISKHNLTKEDVESIKGILNGTHYTRRYGKKGKGGGDVDKR